MQNGMNAMVTDDREKFVLRWCHESFRATYQMRDPILARVAGKWTVVERDA